VEPFQSAANGADVASKCEAVLVAAGSNQISSKKNVELGSAGVGLNQGERTNCGCFLDCRDLRHPFNVIAFQAFIDIVARRCGTLWKCCHTFRATAASLAGLGGSQCCCHPTRLAVRMLAHYGSETRIRSYRTASGKLYLRWKRMSAIGPKQTSLVALHVSAFGGKADIDYVDGCDARAL